MLFFKKLLNWEIELTKYTRNRIFKEMIIQTNKKIIINGKA